MSASSRQTRARAAAIVLLLLALGCAAFGYWGLNTLSGRRSFDEMDGIIPLAAFVAASTLAFAAAVAAWCGRARRA